MAIKCNHCGHELPRDDARFCSKCGNTVSLSPVGKKEVMPEKRSPAEQQSPQRTIRPVQSQGTQSPRSRDEQSEGNGPVEKTIRPQQKETPVVGSLEKTSRPGERRPAELKRQRPSREKVQKQDIAWPSPITHVSTGENTRKPAASEKKESRPSSGVDFRVKVWEPTPEETPKETKAPEKDDIEYFPTRPMSREEIMQRSEAVVQSHQEQESSPESEQRRQVELLETTPMKISGPSWPNPGSQPAAEREQTANSYPEREPRFVSNPGMGPALTGNSENASLGPKPQIPETPKPQRSEPIPETPRPQRPQPTSDRGKKIAWIAIFLLALLAIGCIVWFFSMKPFDSSPEAQPWQALQDQSFGLTLEYPAGWEKKLDGKTLQLLDGSKTGQVDILYEEKAPDDLEQYMKVYSTKIGMSAGKIGAPVTFGGAAWKQMKGAVTLEGAAFTASIYVTAHNGRVYTLVFYGPDKTFDELEKLQFSHIRESLKFQ
ncbi:zinc ribbon protein [Thermosporothrix hazakensis]|uniref:Zinc ribbon protein n=2 Tax=Thermosporothrix hazakensis TaxID=644383 RepID=A0A326U8K3_THEHA|nr:zinc ribbon protein [Thermosporothrix hazakensis]